MTPKLAVACANVLESRYSSPEAGSFPADGEDDGVHQVALHCATLDLKFLAQGLRVMAAFSFFAKRPDANAEVLLEESDLLAGSSALDSLDQMLLDIC